MARQHIVTCVNCGRQFDVNKKGGFYSSTSRRYVCKSCGKKIKAEEKKEKRDEKRASRGNSSGIDKAKVAGAVAYGAAAGARSADAARQRADDREQKTGMRQSMGAMIAKIAIGALFVITSLTMGDAASIAVGMIIGIALIAWGLIPYIKAKKN